MDEHALADVEWKPGRLGPLLDFDPRRFQSFDLRAHSLERSAQVLKHVGGDAFALNQQSEQHVLRADVVAA